VPRSREVGLALVISLISFVAAFTIRVARHVIEMRTNRARLGARSDSREVRDERVLMRTSLYPAVRLLRRLVRRALKDDVAPAIVYSAHSGDEDRSPAGDAADARRAVGGQCGGAPAKARADEVVEIRRLADDDDPWLDGTLASRILKCRAVLQPLVTSASAMVLAVNSLRTSYLAVERFLEMRTVALADMETVIVQKSVDFMSTRFVRDHMRRLAFAARHLLVDLAEPTSADDVARLRCSMVLARTAISDMAP
jgi:hypothetical protein